LQLAFFVANKWKSFNTQLADTKVIEQLSF